MEYIITAFILTVSLVGANPLNGESLDKATANDVVINSVIQSVPNPKTAANIEQRRIETVAIIPEEDKTEVYHTTVNFGGPSRKPGLNVARVIDDIFQIPIGVLQSVAKLLKNPFVTPHKIPESPSSTY